MTPHNALHAARELAKAYLEHQDIPKWGAGAADSGKEAGEFTVEMIKVLAAYFEKAD